MRRLNVILLVIVVLLVWLHGVQAADRGFINDSMISDFDVRAYGATGDGATDDSTAFDNAIAAAADGYVLVPQASASYKLSDDVTIPAGVTVVFQQGGLLSIDNTKTFTVNGSLEAGLYRIFNGNGDVLLAAGSCEYVLPQWWGAVGDDSTDCHAAFESAIDALDGGGMLHVPAGIYRISEPIDNIPVDSYGEVDDAVIIQGVGVQSVLKYMGTSGYCLELGYDDQDSNAGVFYAAIRDLRIEAQQLAALDWAPIAPSGGCIELSKVYFSCIERVFCTGVDSTYGVGVNIRPQEKSLAEASYTHDTDKDFTFTGVGAAEKYAIKFTPSLIVAGYVKTVTVRLKQDGSADGTIHAEVWSDSSGPDVQIGEDSFPINCSDITTGATGEEVTFTFVARDDRPPVANATDYWLVLSTSGYSAGTLTLLVDAVHSSEDEVEVYDWGVSWSTSADGSNNVVKMRTAYEPMWNTLESVKVYGAGGAGWEKALYALNVSGGSTVLSNCSFSGINGVRADGALINVIGCEIAGTGGQNSVNVTGGHTNWRSSYVEIGDIVFDGGNFHSMEGCVLGPEIKSTVGTRLVVRENYPQLLATSDPAVQSQDFRFHIFTPDQIMAGYDGTAGTYARMFNLSSGLTLANDDYALTGKAIQFSTQNKGIQIYFMHADEAYALPRGTYLVSVVAESTNAVNDFYMKAYHRLSDGSGSLMYRIRLTLTSDYETYKFIFRITDAEVTRGAYLYFHKYLADANTISISHIILEYLGTDTVTQHDTISYSSGESDADGARLSRHLFLQKALAAEVLDETDFATHASWDDAGDFDSESGNAAYTHSAGAGTLTQQSGNFANAAGSRYMYRFQYTVSGAAGDPSAEITTAFAFEAQSLDLTDGTHVLYFSSAAAVGNFVISATSSAGDAFTLDDVSLRQTEGHQGQSLLAAITASHDGSSLDEKGKLEIAVNDGNDGFAPTVQATVDSNGLALAAGADVNEFSTDGTLAGDSDDAIPTEKATKAYVDGAVIAALTQEQVEDYVGGMLGGTETNIFVTYQDSTNDIDFEVSATPTFTTVDTGYGQNELYDMDQHLLAASDVMFNDVTVTADLQGDTLNDQFSYMLAGQVLQNATTPPLILAWITPATTESDLSGNSNDATYSNFATSDQIYKGLAWALNFCSGTDEYLTVSDDAAFSWDDTGANPWSVCAWIEVVATGGVQCIIGKYNAQTSDREWVLQLNSSQDAYILLYDEADDKLCTNVTDSPLAVGWHFLVHTYDSTGGANAMSDANSIWYVDGVAVAQSQTNDADYTGMVAGATDVTIGGFNAGGGMTSFFQGDMGIIWIEDTELSAAQVWSAYISQRGYYNE